MTENFAMIHVESIVHQSVKELGFSIMIGLAVPRRLEIMKSTMQID
jgi:hypothetical protein